MADSRAIIDNLNLALEEIDKEVVGRVYEDPARALQWIRVVKIELQLAVKALEQAQRVPDVRETTYWEGQLERVAAPDGWHAKMKITRSTDGHATNWFNLNDNQLASLTEHLLEIEDME